MVKDGEYGEKVVKNAAATCNGLAVTYSLLHADCTDRSIGSDVWFDIKQPNLCRKWALQSAWRKSNSEKACIMVGNSKLLKKACTCNFTHTSAGKPQEKVSSLPSIS